MCLRSLENRNSKLCKISGKFYFTVSLYYNMFIYGQIIKKSKAFSDDFIPINFNSYNKCIQHFQVQHCTYSTLSSDDSVFHHEKTIFIHESCKIRSPFYKLVPKLFTNIKHCFRLLLINLQYIQYTVFV